MKALCIGGGVFVTILAAGVSERALAKTSIPIEKPARSAGDPIDPRLFGTLEWRGIGPSRGGRAVAVAGVVGDPQTYYFGGTGGGLWKTTDAGNSWRPISDGFLKTGSVGAIAVAESDSNVVYVGMGEACVRGNFSHGDGVYRSLDAGKTWKHVGLDDSRQIGRIRVHPKDHDLVYVAALGHVFGPGGQRGVFRSKDGGATWENVLSVDENTGAVDLAMNPRNPRELYAAFWQVRRTPWGLDSGGPGSGLYKSTDGGDSWKKLENGLPKGIKGRIGVTVSPVNPDRVWAMVEAEDGGVFRSDDAGESWRRINSDRSLRQRAWYYTHIYADTQDVETVYVLNVGFGKSTDGGRTFENWIRVPHGDNHDLWINPDDNRNMINSNDGGANVSFDAGASWTAQDNQPTAQFYHVTVDNQFPYRVYGAQQDNSTASVSSRSSPFGRSEFYSVGGGESGYIAVHPEDANTVYAGSYGGYMTRYDHRTRQTRNISVWPDNPIGWGADELKYRFQWTFPIVISPHDPKVIYAAGNVLFKSTNEGHSWKPISPDLTTDDKSKQAASGGPITKDNTSVEYYCTIFAVAESPHEAGVIWAGTDDGLVHLTKNGGRTWTDVTPAGMGENALISLIDASPHEPEAAYLAVTRYKSDDFRPYVFKTENYGKTWRKIAAGIADDAFVRAVREDPVRAGLLYAGTETGVWVSFNDGERWQPLQLNLPVVPITDLVVKDDDLVVATQGRSFWILSGLDVLRQLDAKVAGAAVHLFEPGRSHRTGGEAVTVRYWLAKSPDDALKIEFLESDGEVIRTFERKKKPDGDDAAEHPQTSRRGRFSFGQQSPTADAGMNRFVWDMRYPDAATVPGAVMWGGSTRGPQAAPGKYRVRLTVGETEQTADFEIRPDPRYSTTPEQYRRQFKLLTDIRDAVDETNDAVNQIRDIRGQVDAVSKRAAAMNGAEEIVEAARAINKKLTAIEEELIQTKSQSGQDPLNFPIKLDNKLAALAGPASGNDPPTEQTYAVFEELRGQLDEQLDALRELVDRDIRRFNRLVREHDVPAVWVKKPDKDE